MPLVGHIAGILTLWAIELIKLDVTQVGLSRVCEDAGVRCSYTRGHDVNPSSIDVVLPSVRDGSLTGESLDDPPVALVLWPETMSPKPKWLQCLDTKSRRRVV